jgi:superfamily II DNA or RNA helicase
MSNKANTPTGNLIIPPFLVQAGTYAIGTVRQILRPAGTLDGFDVNEFRVVSRKKGEVYVLSTGERLLVTNQSRCSHPPDIDGILSRHRDGKLYWLSHIRYDEFKTQVNEGKLAQRCSAIEEKWTEALRYKAEAIDQAGDVIRRGLRPPQLGGLHAIGAHWTHSHHPATIVMPTGTGKTETMLAALVAYIHGPLLVVVPSQSLRQQIADKFLRLGLLRELGVIPEVTPLPVVGVITKRPKSLADLDIFDHCNVVVTTMSALGQGEVDAIIPAIADRVSALMVDEAHHVPAKTWSHFREHFSARRVLQFTATPYRRDGQLVDGTVIYSYPLNRAQRDGYFKPITFAPVYELDADQGDAAIAAAAVRRLREDLAGGHSHMLMARCETIDRAKTLHALYKQLAPEYGPKLVSSDDPPTAEDIANLRAGKSRIIVCVDMLGEGFDLPQLKIAAIHDTHKSLAVLLQFTGRFTRTAGSDIGDATVIANIADQRVSDALDRLYSEDADWNSLLSEFSSKAAREHAALIDFLARSKSLCQPDEEGTSPSIARSLLQPAFSAVVFRCEVFRPKNFPKGLTERVTVPAAWLHQDSQTLYFVTRHEPQVRWSRSKQLRNRQWDLFVLHYDPSEKLLYLHSSDTSSLHEELAQAIGGKNVRLIQGETVFRCLGRITRLMFQNIGVRKIGRRSLRYAMYTGAQVEEALSLAEKAGSVKANLAGAGYEGGHRVTIGCSYKGRVWSHAHGPIRSFIDWCQLIGAKLNDASIDTDAILDNVLLPRELTTVPQERVLNIDWPLELLAQSEEQVLLSADGWDVPLAMFDIRYEAINPSKKLILFRIETHDFGATLALKISKSRGFEVQLVGGTPITIRYGRREWPLAAYLSENPPLIRFCDLSELDGNLLVTPKERRAFTFPSEHFEPWDWSGTDITIESIWKGDTERKDSIQQRAADHYNSGGFQVVFNDDDKGEAADLVCLKEEADSIRLALVHCKFSGAPDPGSRVKDVVEVCSQAVRSAKWRWRFRELCRHIILREKRLRTPSRPTRFLKGHPKDLNHFLRISRFKEAKAEIVIVQPGLSQRNCTSEQTVILAAAHAFLKETVGIDLDVVCSD